jgi:hypothetical protein
VSATYERKRLALAAYTFVFAPIEQDHLLALCQTEDQFHGRMLGVRYAEIFCSAAPLLATDPTVFRPAARDRLGKRPPP